MAEPTIQSWAMDENYVPPIPGPRKLAHICKVTNVRHILSYAKNVAVNVGKWTVAIKQGAFKEGDLALFIEIDAFLPAEDKRFGCKGTPQTFKGKSGYRVQTETYSSGRNKILSQGRLFHLKDFPEVDKLVEEIEDAFARCESPQCRNPEFIKNCTLMLYEDWDFAEALGIVKWEESEEAALTRLGGFPTALIPKTNHERVQNCPNLFLKPKYKRLQYQESVKMDGASMTVYFVRESCPKFRSLNPLPSRADIIGPNMVLDPSGVGGPKGGSSGKGRFGVCSHNCDLNEFGESMYWDAARDAGLPGKLARLGMNVAIQGELCGEGINKNREGLAAGTREFYVFAMWDIDRQAYYKPADVELHARQLSLKHVPVLGYVRLWDIARCHDELLQRAAARDGEGLVFKCVEDGRWFKVISNEYLLKNGL